MTVNIAVIGAGRIGKMHAEIVATTPGATLRGVVDRRQQDKNWLPRLGLAHTTVYPDADAALADDKVDAVLIATSSDSHIPLITAAVAAGKKIFCEKPVAFTARAIHDLQQSLPAAALIQIGFNRRFDPAFAALKESLTAGALGRIYSYHITNRDPRRPPAGFVGRSGGMLLDFNVHDFDMLAHLSAARVSEIFARGANLLRDQAMLAAGDIDTVIISLTMDNGALANIDCARESGFGYDQRIEVMGEKGGLRVDNEHHRRPTRLTADGLLAAPLRDNFIDRFAASYRAQTRAFIAACRDEAPCPVGLREAAAAVAAAEAGTKSLTSGANEKIDTTE